MRFVVFGAGAIGGTIGALLFEAGHEVVLIARGAHLDAIQRDGLTFVDPLHTVTLPIPAVVHPSEIEFTDGDVVLLTTKTQDSVPALERLRDAARGREFAIACVQNGVENERLALRLFRRVYGTFVIVPATHLQPGVVECHYARPNGILDTGRYPSGADDTSTAIAEALASAGFDARSEPSVMRWKYTKLLTSVANSVQAAIGTASGAEDLVKAARQEAIDCFTAAGIDFASTEEFDARRDVLTVSVATPPTGGSSWQSLARGSGTIEADYLNGEVVLLGARWGIETPVNRALQALAAGLAGSKATAGSMSADELVRLIRA